MDRLPHRTRDKLIEHANYFWRTVIDYSFKQFHDVTGDLHKGMDILDQDPAPTSDLNPQTHVLCDNYILS